MTSEPGAAPTRNCVSCGRAISWDANVCPYCGHDFRAAPSYAPRESISDGMKILLYILSFLFFLIGIIVGIIYYTKPEPELKEFGKMCIILAVIGALIGGLCYCIGFAAMI